jgi:hypothetical protein
MNLEGVMRNTRAVETSLNEVIKGVREAPLRLAPARKGAVAIDFDVGDYVLTARQQTKKDKTAPLWEGPAVVVAAENERSFQIKDLISGSVRTVHADFIKRYADAKLHVTEQLKSFIAAAAVYCRVRAVTAHRKNGAEWELCVVWEGFDDEDFTWQKAKQLHEDVPVIVERYVKTIVDVRAQDELKKLLKLK